MYHEYHDTYRDLYHGMYHEYHGLYDIRLLITFSLVAGIGPGREAGGFECVAGEYLRGEEQTARAAQQDEEGAQRDK